MVSQEDCMSKWLDDVGTVVSIDNFSLHRFMSALPATKQA